MDSSGQRLWLQWQQVLRCCCSPGAAFAQCTFKHAMVCHIRALRWSAFHDYVCHVSAVMCSAVHGSVWDHSRHPGSNRLCCGKTSHSENAGEQAVMCILCLIWVDETALKAMACWQHQGLDIRALPFVNITKHLQTSISRNL